MGTRSGAPWHTVGVPRRTVPTVPTVAGVATVPTVPTVAGVPTMPTVPTASRRTGSTVSTGSKGSTGSTGSKGSTGSTGSRGSAGLRSGIRPGAAVDASPLRRQPRQARAQERLERILEAAEQLFAEVGFDAATTNQIAVEAGTSIGSLYEFFPNKEAVAQALAERYVERIGGLYDELLGPSAGGGEPNRARVAEEENPHDLVHRVVNALDRFYREHPGAVPLLNGRLTSPELAAAGERLHDAFVRSIEAVVRHRRPDLPAARGRLTSLLIAEIARSGLVLADRVPLSQRAAVLRELETAIIGYLELSLPPLDGVVPES
jgi:AcrR family transcriptional regulator